MSSPTSLVVPTLRRIVSVVLVASGVPRSELTTQSRHPRVVRVRRVIVLLGRRYGFTWERCAVVAGFASHSGAVGAARAGAADSATLGLLEAVLDAEVLNAD